MSMIFHRRIPLFAIPVRISCNYVLISGGTKGGARDTPPRGQNSFNFMQFCENLAKSYVGAPPSPGELTPSPRGNSGSTTVNRTVFYPTPWWGHRQVQSSCFLDFFISGSDSSTGETRLRPVLRWATVLCYEMQFQRTILT